MNTILDHSPCFYFCFDDNGKIISINQTFCNQLQYQKEELINQLLDSIFTLPSRIFYQTHWNPLLRLQGYVNELYISFAAKDKSPHPVLVNSVRKEENGIFITECVGILVVNRRKYEEEILSAKKAYESALQTNSALISAQQELQRHAEILDQSLRRVAIQNDELKQINKIVTHDLQEPVRKLLFYNDRLQNERDFLTDEAILNVNLLQKVTQRFTTILSGLQQYVWLTEMEESFTDVDLNVIITEATRKINKDFTWADHQITTATLPVIQGNHTQLLAMFTHILDNAVRFRKEGQTAIVDITSIMLEQNSFKNTPGKYRYSEYVRITISDNGRGFDNALQTKVFDLLYKLDNNTGAGLGLSITKKVVAFHHGSVEAQSEPGLGTKIMITLPVNVKEIRP